MQWFPAMTTLATPVFLFKLIHAELHPKQLNKNLWAWSPNTKSSRSLWRDSAMWSALRTTVVMAHVGPHNVFEYELRLSTSKSREGLWWDSLWWGVYWPKVWAEMEEGGSSNPHQSGLAQGSVWWGAGPCCQLLFSLTKIRKNTRGQQHTKNVLVKVEGWRFAVWGTHFLKPYPVVKTARVYGIPCPCLLWIGLHTCVLVKIDSVWSWLLAIDKETSRNAQLPNPVLDTRLFFRFNLYL